MKKIVNDFLRKEIKRMALGLLALILLWAGIFSFLPEMRRLLFPCFTIFVPVFLLLLLGVTVFRFVRSRANIGGLLSDREAELLERQYTADHPIYRVAYGELHLLDDFVVSRNKGRLIVIPLNRIERVEECFRLVAARIVPYLILVLDTGKRVSLDFSVWHNRDGAPVMSWLSERLGAEKVGYGTNKPGLLR